LLFVTSTEHAKGSLACKLAEEPFAAGTVSQ